MVGVLQALSQLANGHICHRICYLEDLGVHIGGKFSRQLTGDHTRRRTLLLRGSHIHTLGTSSALPSDLATVYDRQGRMSSISPMSHSNLGSHKTLFCLDKLLTSHYLHVILTNKSYAQGGPNAGILHEMQKKG
jgi:hypothetical protein